MLSIGGIVFLLACVFGTFIITGGAIGPLLGSMPFEFVTIGGAAIGVLVAGNSMHDVKHTLADFKKIIKGSRYHKTDYVELLCLLFFLVKLAATKGAMALESHIENAADSPAFQHFPKILANHHATNMMCDYLRMVGMNADDPHQIEDIMARELKKNPQRRTARRARVANHGGWTAGARNCGCGAGSY